MKNKGQSKDSRWGSVGGSGRGLLRCAPQHNHKPRRAVSTPHPSNARHTARPCDLRAGGVPSTFDARRVGALTAVALWAPCLVLGLGCEAERDPSVTLAPRSQPQAGAGSGDDPGAGEPPMQPITAPPPAAAEPEPAQEPMDGAAMPAEPADPPVPAAPEPAFGADADVFEWSTGEFTLEAGQERYLCFASTLSEDLTVNGYHTSGQPFQHHLILSRASAPEPEGFAECDIAFRSSWEILFITGTGDTKLEFPQDAAHILGGGTQLVLQMHLLNTRDEAVTGSVAIDMRRTQVDNPRPVNSFIFGTAAVELPPAQTSDVVGTCSMFQSVQLIAGFPHMHLRGRAMRFEVGASVGELQEVYRRDPFDFDSQQMDMLDLSVSAGQVTRVTCTFDNPTDEVISYGESTNEEMCYFVGFAVDLPGQSACLEVIPPSVFGF